MVTSRKLSLKELALEILDKYEHAEQAAIAEYSKNPSEDWAELREEVRTYHRQIHACVG